MKRVYLLAPLSVVTLILMGAGCSARTDIVLNPDRSGTATVQIEVSPLLTRYYTDLATGFVPNFDPQNPRLFDLEALRQRISLERNLSLTTARTPAPNRLEATFSFTNLSTLFADPKVGNAVSMTSQNREETIRLLLNRDTISAILSLAVDSQSPMYRMLLPQGSGSITPEEYRRQLSWVLEEYASARELEETLTGARILVSIRAPGLILRQKGGVQEGTQQVRFTIPLLTLLTTPLEYEITYR